MIIDWNGLQAYSLGLIVNWSVPTPAIPSIHPILGDFGIIETRNSADELTGMLLQAYNRRYVQIANEPSRLIFSYPAGETFAAEIKRANLFWLWDKDGNLLDKFCMQVKRSTRSSEGLAYYQAECISLMGQLSGETIDYYFASYLDAKSISTIVTDLLDLQLHASPITIGDIDAAIGDEIREIELQNTSILQALGKLRESIGGYILINPDRTLDWKVSIGEDKGQQLRYAKNIKGMERVEDYTALVTRLYYYGQGEGDARVTLENIVELLADNAASGQKEVVLVDKAAGDKFSAGYHITLSDDAPNSETCEIASIAPATLTMVDNLTNSYTTANNAQVALKAYLDSDTQGTHGIVSRPVTDKQITFIEDSDLLLELARQYLAAHKNPVYSYAVNFADLSELPGGLDFEALQLGSLVTVIDEDLGIDVEVYIIKIDKNLDRPVETELELSTHLPTVISEFLGVYEKQQILQNTNAITISPEKIYVQREVVFLDWLTGGQTAIIGNYVRTGLLESDNWAADAGTQIALTGETIKIGGSAAPKFYWDGTDLVIEGTVTILNPGDIALSTLGGLLVQGQLDVDAVIAESIEAGAVETDKLDALAVTAGKIAAKAVTFEKLEGMSFGNLVANPSFVEALGTDWHVEADGWARDETDYKTAPAGMTCLVKTGNRNFWGNRFPAQEGDIVTLEVQVFRKDAANGELRIHVGFGGATWTGNPWVGYINLASEDTDGTYGAAWKTITVTGKAGAGTTQCCVWFAVLLHGTPVGKWHLDDVQVTRSSQIIVHGTLGARRVVVTGDGLEQYDSSNNKIVYVSTGADGLVINQVGADYFLIFQRSGTPVGAVGCPGSTDLYLLAQVNSSIVLLGSKNAGGTARNVILSGAANSGDGAFYPASVVTNLGIAAQYWDEFHYVSLHSHSPKFLKNIDHLATILGIKADDEGKFIKKSLPLGIYTPASLMDILENPDADSICMDNLLTTAIGAIKQLTERVEELEAKLDT